VLAGLAAARAGFAWADPLAAALVAVLVARAAWGILRHAGDVLVDRAPAETTELVRRAIGRVVGVREVRAVRVRMAGPHAIGDARVATGRMLSIESAHALRDRVRAAARGVLPGLDLTVAVEGFRADGDLVERVHAATARHGVVRDVHNVLVEHEKDGTLHLSLHAKLPGEVELTEALAVSAALEEVLRGEMPDVTRVDVHLEPLDSGVVRGEDVTDQRSPLADGIRALVVADPRVVECRDVELSARGHHVAAHVVVVLAEGITLGAAHAVETDLESRLRQGFPDVYRVLVRAAS
jgi:divalent metal cation (Fe/Co/Zn/Cd) transporter